MYKKWVNTSIFLIAVVGIFLIIYKPWNITDITDNRKVIRDQSYTNIEIVTANTKVVIVPTKRNETTVDLSGRGLNISQFTFEADVRGDTLSVLFKEKRRVFSGLSNLLSNLTLTVNVPEKQYNMIEVNSKNGRIDVGHITAEVVSLETRNGKIISNNIQAETVDVNTRNGAIELSNITSSTVNAKTNNGKLTFDQVTGQTTGKTSNGRISFFTYNLDQMIDLTTRNGKIEIVSTKEPTNARIEAKTNNGKINVFGHNNALTTFGNGEHLIKLRTHNGKVEVTN